MVFFNLREVLPGLEVMVPQVEGGLTSPRVVPGLAHQNHRELAHEAESTFPQDHQVIPKHGEFEKHSCRAQKTSQLEVEATYSTLFSDSLCPVWVQRCLRALPLAVFGVRQ